ncbi:hypothetical protein BJF85_20395 [Saccharomonospora sp. CUA-673]|uniref:hypothetical protein n=1 Tax=Saccharomonospora sp. CUA-673 TaxID=1904969 RepID=UPI000966DF63|nr:hypothetical protein [Saccharomonospora sp. CUA-673]OLT44239.1 hypothetical protein BJF85_20395 [Saccharomonospora sp. CUA-673]
MGVVNVHERRFAVPQDQVGALIDALAGDDDPVWPGKLWPPLRLDRPLGVGATGGHGPVRYHVIAYVPGRWVRFSFDRPTGFDGVHEFTALTDGDHTVLRHLIAMRVHGTARLSWPLVYGPLHDALLEDLLDRAEHRITGTIATPARWNPWVRLLRRLATR